MEAEPKLVSLIYFVGKGQLQIMGFQNPFSKIGTTGFMLEPGITTITGAITGTDHNATNPLRLTGGRQTEIMFKTDGQDFGYIGAKDPAARKKIVAGYITTIKAYPESFFLLNKILVNRQLYSGDELLQLLNSFDLTLRSSKQAIQILKTAKVISAPAKLDRLMCRTPNGKDIDALKSPAKTRVLIFWASWCIPCRNEIPFLKQLYLRRSQKDVSFVSISMDSNSKAWLKALGQEKMQWEQCIVNGNSDTIKDAFKFAYIPVVFIVQNQKVIKRYDGFSEKEFSDISHFLNSLK
ncbi:MAG: TlpA family protein disulfide reductase [Mucilaginibacter sp.]